VQNTPRIDRPVSSFSVAPQRARVEQLTHWPQHVAVLWSKSPPTAVFEQLRGAQVDVLRIPPAETVELLSHLGPVSLLLVDGNDFGAELADSLAAVRALQSDVRTALLVSPDTSREALFTAMQAGVTQLVDPKRADFLPAVLGAMLSSRPRNRVLAIGAHPDDVELGCAGTLLAHRNRGDLITVLTLSAGQVGGAVRARRREAVNASIAMHAQLFLGDFPDTQLGQDPDLIRVIEQVVATVDPDTVYVHSSADTHQDHRAVHEAAVSATRRVPNVLCFQSPSATNAFQPSNFLRVDDQMDGKVEVLSHFASQASRPYLEEELIRSVARYWARQLPSPVRYAEPFEVIRSASAP